MDIHAVFAVACWGVLLLQGIGVEGLRAYPAVAASEGPEVPNVRVPVANVDVDEIVVVPQSHLSCTSTTLLTNTTATTLT